MALSALVVFEIRVSGSDQNGGGFHTGASGQNMSLFDNKNSSGGTNCFSTTADLSVTDGVTAGTTTITSATANFSTNIVGNLIYVSGGTGSVVANWYEVTARASATSITVDRSTGLTTGTGVTLNIGGAFGTPGVLSTLSGLGIGGQLVSGQKAWWQYNASTYNCSTSTAGPSGPCQIPASVVFVLEGYDATRGDRTGNRPTYLWTAAAPGANTYLVLLNAGAKQHVANVILDGGSVAKVCGCNCSATRASISESIIQHCNQAGAIGVNIAISSTAILASKILDCTTGTSGPGLVINCDIASCPTGISSPTLARNCLVRGCTNGVSCTTGFFYLERVTADACTTAGFALSLSSATVIGCLATNCTGSAKGFDIGTSTNSLINCAAYNNTTHVNGTPLSNEGPFASGNTLTGLVVDPYVSWATGDFRPNNNSPGGKQLWNAGIGVYGQTDSADIGSVQHTDPASSGGIMINPGMSGGLR